MRAGVLALWLGIAAAGSGAWAETHSIRPLVESQWQALPGSAMDSVFVPAVDDVWSRAPKSWSMVQAAWSGGVCVGSELFLWGGGHGDGAHNGLLAVDVLTGHWRRVTEPSPIWTAEACPDGLCDAPTGKCPLGECNAGPDGRPVARHTYYLLASDGRSIYSVGGSIWGKGSSGDGPNGWRFDLENRGWHPLPGESPIARPHGSLAVVDRKLYHMTARGFAIFDLESEVWTRAGNAVGWGGKTGLVYAPSVDRFYALGGGVAVTIDRSEWGNETEAIVGAPGIAAESGIGLAYFPPEDRILLWNGGPRIVTLDPKTHQWGEVDPGGDPGAPLPKGTFGRFAYCGGRVVLVNGTSNDLSYLDFSDAPSTELPLAKAAELQGSPQGAKEPEPPRQDRRGRDRAREPKGPVAQALAPYYADPPKDRIVLDECGPEAKWGAIEVTSSEDVDELQHEIARDSNVVVRVHWRKDPYPVLNVKNGRCVKVLGLSGPDGQRPLVAGVNATAAFRGEIRRGGVIVENLEVSPGKIARESPSVKIPSGDCLGVPNDRMFYIVRDSDISRCGHHAFVTAHAHHLYVEIGRSHFAQASSHLAYIDHIAMAYVYDSSFESPGWGHALRCIALRCVIERTQVSNVQLDGQVLPEGGDNPLQPKRTYLGMQPLEVYTCGINDLRDVEVTFRSDEGRNGAFAAILRGREAFRTCDVGEVVDGHWTRLEWGDPDFSDPRRWSSVTPLVTTVDNFVVKCVGPSKCAGWEIKGNYPVMDDAQKEELAAWLKASRFATWEKLLSAIPADRPHWGWVASVTLPGHRESFLDGAITNKVPLPVPLPGWFQRTRVIFRGARVEGGELFRAEKEPSSYCYGTPPLSDSSGKPLDECADQFDGAHFQEAFLETQDKR